ncbi:hypothetical protein EV426DRAFT_595118 [Tirmania nivea]|nr:hypothetical protein EV426DRAFT_595118 [Tirmania nivea]
MTGGPAVVKEALADALQEVWKDIPESLLESLYSSMPRRVAAVIKAEGCLSAMAFPHHQLSYFLTIQPLNLLDITDISIG